jgi:hypothetical protein
MAFFLTTDLTIRLFFNEWLDETKLFSTDFLGSEYSNLNTTPRSPKLICSGLYLRVGCG